MKSTWKITTFEHGQPVAEHVGVPHDEALRLIARAQDASLDVEHELAAGERHQPQLQAAA